MRLSEAEAQGLTSTRLDSLYAPALSDSLAVFAGNESSYVDAYFEMNRALSTYLNEQNFILGSSIKCYQRIYFNEEGSIDYFIYSFEENVMDEERMQEFEQLLNEFIITYEFPLASKKRFSQISPVNLRDVL